MLNRPWFMSPALMVAWSLSLGAQSLTPAQHIEAARGILANVSDATLKKQGRERLEELRKLFDEMAKAYPNSADWRTKFSAVESQLTRIIGGGRGPGLESATTGVGGRGAATGSGAALGNQVGTAAAGTVSGTASGTGSGAAAGTPAGTVAGTAAGTGSGATVTGGTGQTGTATGQGNSGSVGSGGTPTGVGGGSVVAGSGAQANAGATAATSTAAGTGQTGDIGPAGNAAIGSGQGGSSVGAGSGIAVVGEIGMKDIDPAVREQLRAFRLEVELFFASALTDNLTAARTAKP